MLGISSYFKDIDYKYLKEASLMGAKYLFTSLQIPEESSELIENELPRFIEFCRESNFDLVLDISPVTFEKLNLKNNDFISLKNIGIKTLRLDYGFDDFKLIKSLQEDFKIVLNASIVDRDFIVDAIKNGVNIKDISVMHNFYPKINTGLSIEYFNKLNEVFVEYGIKIMAFVSGDLLKRFPNYEGLVTIEKHRSINPFVSAVELIKKCGVSDVVIGDSKAKVSTLNLMKKYLDDNILSIPVFLDKDFEYLYDKKLKVRKDLSENIVRIISDRRSDVPILNNTYRKRGYITLDNKLAGRYSGELQIIKKDLDMDARSNVIGFIHPEYIDIIDYITNREVINFIRL